MTTAIPDPPFSLEQSLLHISDLARCCSAVAYEAGDCLNGTQRDMVFSVVHMLGTIKAEVERSLAHVEAR
jgi:hypothetical protein